MQHPTRHPAQKQCKPLVVKKAVEKTLSQFLIGVVVGGVIGFFICAILQINNSEKDSELPTPVIKEAGDSDAPRN